METSRQKIVNRATQAKPAAATWVAAMPGPAARGAVSVAPSLAGVMPPVARTGGALAPLRPDLRAPSLERFGVISLTASAQHHPQQSPSGEAPPWTRGHRAGQVTLQSPARPTSSQVAADVGVRNTPEVAVAKDPSPAQEPASADDRWAKRTMPIAPAEQAPTPPPPALPAGITAPSQAEAADTGATGREPAVEPRREIAPQAAAPQSDLLGNPQIPIAGDATASLAQIDSHAQTSNLLVSAEAKAKRSLIKLFVGGHRRLITALIGSHIQALSTFVGLQQARAVFWLTSRAALVQGFVLGLIARAVGIGAGIAGRIQGQIEGLTAGVVTGVNAVIDRVLDIAHSIPIPNIPGLGRVRSTVLHAANRIGEVIRRALANVQRFIARVIGSVLAAILSLIGRVGAALANIVARLVAVVTHVVLALTRVMRSLSNWIVARLRRLVDRVRVLLARIQSMALARIDRAEAQAHAAIAANRQHGRATILHILEFCYNQGDYPADESVSGLLERVDNTSSKEEFESSARAALHLVTARTMVRNFEIVQRFRVETASLLALVKGAITDFLGDVRRRVVQVVQKEVAQVTGVVGQLISSVTTVATRIMAAVGILINRLGSMLDRVRTVVAEVVRVPLNALTSTARAIIGAVRSFLQRVVSRLVNLLRSVIGGGGEGVPDPSSLTNGFAAFDPARLAATARMASPPAAAAGVLVAIGAAIAAAATAILAAIAWFNAVVLPWLVLIAAIVLIVLVILWIIAKVRAMPRAPAKPSRTRPGVRRRRSLKRPLRWNPSQSYPKVVGTGGMHGILDPTTRLPKRAPMHGHHVWPQFVGGAPAQPLMAIRNMVHISFVHPAFNRLLLSTARGMGHTISTHTTDPRNIAFVAHLRRDIRRRGAYSGVMVGYYAGLNMVTHPPIPAAAYLRGIAYSFPRI